MNKYTNQAKMGYSYQGYPDLDEAMEMDEYGDVEYYDEEEGSSSGDQFYTQQQYQ